MMRSLYSGVAGLKTHQTKMDVIGNNIANVNTVGFKSSAVNFQDTFYQTVTSASGANADLRTAGTNAKQIGLGSSVAAIQVNITEQGGPSTTNRALDVAINGEAFIVVRSGSETLFTKSGAFNVDEEGTLYCTTNGTTIQGWVADNDGNIIKDRVKDLKVMSSDNMYYPPSATESITLSGNIDPNDSHLENEGVVITYSFFDKIGETYSAQLYVKKNPADSTGGVASYDVYLKDILNSDSKSIFVIQDAQGNYVKNPTAEVKFGDVTLNANNATVNARTGELTNLGVTDSATPATGRISQLQFDSATGEKAKLLPARANNADLSGIAVNMAITGSVPILDSTTGFLVSSTNVAAQSTFRQNPDQAGDPADSGGVNIYFNSLTQYSQGGVSKVNSAKGNPQGEGVGNTAGRMKGLAIDEKGYIWGTYDNGMKRCLAQLSVATFANPSGLESRGNSLFAASLNSGEFDDVGEEITLSGSFTVGALEMSNVDLANEFTQMITTQRGFQANSRIITTSDSMLEELVNLKR